MLASPTQRASRDAEGCNTPCYNMILKVFTDLGMVVKAPARRLKSLRVFGPTWRANVVICMRRSSNEGPR